MRLRRRVENLQLRKVGYRILLTPYFVILPPFLLHLEISFFPQSNKFQDAFRYFPPYYPPARYRGECSPTEEGCRHASPRRLRPRSCCPGVDQASLVSIILP